MQKREMGFYSQLQQYSSSILWFEKKPQNTKTSAEQLSESLGTHKQSLTGVVRFTQLCSPGTIPWELIQLLLTGNMQNDIFKTTHHSGNLFGYLYDSINRLGLHT